MPAQRAGQCFRASLAQDRLAFLQELTNDRVYNLTIACRIHGPLDAGALELAVETVLQRHEILRTRFRSEDGQLMQVVDEMRALPAIEHVNAESEETLHVLLAERAAVSFDLERHAPFEPVLYELSANDHALAFFTHHLVFDGWSTGILFGELEAAYRSAVRREAVRLPDLHIQYADFAAWQRTAGAAAAADIAYWVAELEDAPRELPLPSDPPHSNPPGSGRRIRFRCSAEVSAAVAEAASRYDCTTAVVLLTAFFVLLFRCTGRRDVVVGVPVANRERLELEPLIGLFVNTFAVRVAIESDAPLSRILDVVTQKMRNALLHRGAPFEQVVEALGGSRALTHSPLFQTWFNFGSEGALPDLPGLVVTPIEVHNGTVKLSLQLSMSAGPDGGLSGALEYDTGIFSDAAGALLVNQYQACLERLVFAPGEALSDTLLDRDVPRAREPVAGAFATTEENVSKRARSSGSSIALAGMVHRLTYGELDARASALAQCLRARGVVPGSVVAVFFSSTFDSIVAILAAHKLRAAYLPLDEGAPPRRLVAMIEAMHATHVLTEPASSARFAGTKVEQVVVRLDDLPECPPEPFGASPSSEDLAYVVATSGSTGAPKGVEVTHAALSNYVDAISTALHLTSRSSFMLASGVAADLGYTALFPTLSCGATLVIAGREEQCDPAHFARLAEMYRPTHLKIVPSHLDALFEALAERLPGGIETVVLGGEATSLDLLERISARWPRTRIVNHYGPTEATIGSTMFAAPAPAADRYRNGLPIGKPLPGVDAFVLDEHLRPLPAGVPGELYIGGKGLARGYRLRPGATAERFVPNPFSEGERLYRSGDLVRRLPSGDLHFLGRKDRQVKLRGYRVEPAEVEEALRRLSPRAKVCAPGDASEGAGLIAALPVQDQSSESALRAALAVQLPDYLVPTHWLFLETFPRKPNGKLDENALRAMAAALADSKGERRSMTPAEGAVHDIWTDVLRRPHVPCDVSFFEVGGHSLSAMRVVARIRDRLGVTIPVRTFFTTPTISELARYVEAHGAGARTGDVIVRQPRHAGPPP